MAVKELTVEEKLVSLTKLQKIDTKLNEITILKGELPIEVQDLEDEVAGFEKRIDKINDSIKDAEANISDYNHTIKDAEALIVKYNKQQANVKNNREFDALTKEVELQELEIQLCQKRIREANKEIDSLKETLEQSTSKIDGKKSELNHKKDELEKIISETEKEENDLRKKAEKAKKGIEERLITAYTRIKNSYKNGQAVVTFDRNSCSGCFNKIPAQQQLEIKQRTKMIICEHCGRILVDPELMNNN